MGRANSPYLVTGLSTAARNCGKVAQATPSCRPWLVVMSSRHIYKVSRAFGSSSSRVREFPGE